MMKRWVGMSKLVKLMYLMLLIVISYSLMELSKLKTPVILVEEELLNDEIRDKNLRNSTPSYVSPGQRLVRLWIDVPTAFPWRQCLQVYCTVLYCTILYCTAGVGGPGAEPGVCPGRGPPAPAADLHLGTPAGGGGQVPAGGERRAGGRVCRWGQHHQGRQECGEAGGPDPDMLRTAGRILEVE